MRLPSAVMFGFFPKDEDRANVGVGIAGNCEKTAKYYLDKFIIFKTSPLGA